VRFATDMILPCRIHRPRKLIDLLPLAFLVAAFLLIPCTEAMAQYGAGSSEGAGVGGGRTVPLDITAGVDIGYDDHVLGSSSTTSSSGQSSFFARENVVLSYDRPKERNELRLVAVGRFAQFFDAGTDDKDGTVTLALTHYFSRRLFFRADVYAAYQTEPNFQSNVGPENVRAPHFDTSDVLSVTYHWFPRFAMVTSYTFRSVQYESSSSVGTSQNRVDNTIGEALRFSLTKRTDLIGEYRFQTIDYETATNNSITHYVLVGVDHHLTEHLRFDARGGPSFRSLENDGNTVNPYFEGGLEYQRSNHSLTWLTTYGYESPTAANVSNRTTIRTGVNLTYHLTSRVHSTAALYYHHDDNQGGSSGTTSEGTQDSLEFSLGVRYTINRRLSLQADYRHTMQSSQGSTSGYSRNRYSAGLTYTY
jgi:Putative beta-barrel porin 2